MGGRGGSSAISRAGNSNGVLSQIKIDRANGASALGNAGDIIQRRYAKNVAEISNMKLTSKEKTAAIAKQHSLAEKALTTTAAYPSWSRTGRARVNVAKSRVGADKIASANASVESHMKQIRKSSTVNSKASTKKQNALVVQKALAEGKLEVTVNGKRYVRKNKRARSFTLAN